MLEFHTKHMWNVGDALLVLKLVYSSHITITSWYNLHQYRCNTHLYG